MNPSARSTIQSVFEISLRGEMHFGEVLARLAGVGVESYRVDYRAATTTYVLSDDDVMELRFPVMDIPVADTFDGQALQAAIRAVQQGRLMYPAFKRLTHEAGCVGYTVWLAGRHVTYYGRRGETHVEHFPT